MFYSIFLIIETKEESDIVEKIFLTQYKRMYYAAFSILKNESDAEDAVMNAFVYISKHPEKFIGYTGIETEGLLSLCIKSAAIDIYRKKKRMLKTISFEENVVDSELIDCSDVSDLIISQENIDIIINEIRNMDAEYKILIELRYFYHWKIIEIAEFVKVTPPTITKRIQKAKATLAKSLRKKGVHF